MVENKNKKIVFYLFLTVIIIVCGVFAIDYLVKTLGIGFYRNQIIISTNEGRIKKIKDYNLRYFNSDYGKSPDEPVEKQIISFPDQAGIETYSGDTVLTCCDSPCGLAKDSLTAKRTGTYIATRSFTSGKVYFETQIHPRFLCSYPGNQTEIGVTAGRDFVAPGYPNYSANVDALSPSDLRDKDVIGIAMDLDRKRLYFSLNGEWLDGNPAKQIGGLRMHNATGYRAAIHVDGPDMEPGFGFDSLAVNFGSKPFKYLIPAGFKPYNSK